MSTKQRTTETIIYRRGLGVQCRDIQSERSVLNMWFIVAFKINLLASKGKFLFHIEEVAKCYCLGSLRLRVRH